MKQILVATIGLALVLTSCGGDKGSGGAGNGETKFAYFIKDSIPEHFTVYKEAQAELEIKGQEYEQRLFQLQQDGQQKLDSYQRQMGAGLLSNNDIARKEQEIQIIQQQIQVLQETDGADLSRKGSEMTLDVLEKMSQYGKEFANENGISVFLGSEQGGAILYMDSTMNVTMEFIDYMNKKELESKTDK